uniref:Uncharacterized protein n=1 Tax=viral metagenome TaxID=1070528 RepID=A0A6H1ZD32_9ZZZZ
MDWTSAIEIYRLEKERDRIENEFPLKEIIKMNIRCNYCGTTENIDIPGLCKNIECQRKARTILKK